jgi:hypothetical protein
MKGIDMDKPGLDPCESAPPEEPRVCKLSLQLKVLRLDIVSMDRILDAIPTSVRNSNEESK